MTKKLLRFCVVLLASMGLSTVYAQESPTAAGGDATGAGGSLSYSVGQTFYTWNEDATASTLGGVQQPFEISNVVGIEQTETIRLQLSAFPNPSVDMLTLSIDNYGGEVLYYQLHDIAGKLIRNARITDSMTSIPVADLVPASYLLRVMHKNKDIKTFKIVKRD